MNSPSEKLTILETLRKAAHQFNMNPPDRAFLMRHLDRLLLLEREALAPEPTVTAKAKPRRVAAAKPLAVPGSVSTTDLDLG